MIAPVGVSLRRKGVGKHFLNILYTVVNHRTGSSLSKIHVLAAVHKRHCRIRNIAESAHQIEVAQCTQSLHL